MNTTPPPPRVASVVFTGGPCAGKSTAMVSCREYFEPLCWHVIVVPETATLLIGTGITPFNGHGSQFQRSVMGMQLSMEREARLYAESLKKNVLMICDRGVMDGAAYSPNEEFDALLAEQGTSRFKARDGYHDAVIHLVTAAKGAPEFYTLENNAARTETPAQAIALDDRTMQTWVGHPHMRVVGNEGSFKTKINQVIKDIAVVLGVPEPIERERKFLVRVGEMPPAVRASGVSIVQTYLPDDGSQEIRLRRREQNGECFFIETIKRPVPGDASARYETERNLSEAEYLARQPGGVAELIKSRHYCAHLDEKTGGHHYLEVDVYDRSRLSSAAADRAPSGAWGVVEIETESTAPIGFPPWLEVIEEVTGQKAWGNRKMAGPTKDAVKESDLSSLRATHILRAPTIGGADQPSRGELAAPGL